MKRRDDIKNELKEIAPTLSERVSTNPFKVPENYFDALPQNTLQHVKGVNALVESVNDESNVSNTCPPGRNPFETPKEYFNELPNEILQRVKSEPKVVALAPSRWKNSLSIAAAVAALFLMSVPMLRNQNIIDTNSTKPVATNVTMEQVSDEELYNYLTNDVGTVHEEEITAHVSDATLDTLEQELISINVSSSYDAALLDISDFDLDLIELL